METIVREIEEEGEKYGMKLNKDKSEALQTDNDESIKFSNGECIKAKKEVKYLGCMLNQKADISR